jgi:hypothetical protein
LSLVVFDIVPMRLVKNLGHPMHPDTDLLVDQPVRGPVPDPIWATAYIAGRLTFLICP